MLVGLVGVAAYNWRKWQRDKELLALQKEPDSLPPLKSWPELPLASVLVAAWNEATTIERHIGSFLSLRYPHKELILCAGGEDGTYDLACRHADEQVTVLQQQAGEGKQRALRRCLARASGTTIFLTDADCLLDDQAFEQTLAAVVKAGYSAATGRFAPLDDQRDNAFVLTQWYTDSYARARSPSHLEGLIGRNAAVSRAALVRSGGFSRPVPIGTDYYLARQLVASGVTIRYVHHSAVQTEFKTNGRAYLRQQSRWLRNILLHGRAFGATRQVSNALRHCLVGAGVVLWPLALPLTKKLGAATWLCVLAHGTMSRFRYTRFGELTLAQPLRLRVYLLAPLLMLLDMFMLLYTLIEWMLPDLRESW